MNTMRFDPIEFLHKDDTLKILSYLKPEDLVQCLKVSKKWKQLASNEDLWKPYSYNEIFKEYDVLHSYNISKIQDAKLIFLSESHASINTPGGESRKLNDRFIFALAKHQPIAVFRECKPSMEPLQISKEKDNTFFNLVFSINTQRIMMFGWDDYDKEMSEKGKLSLEKQVKYEEINQQINLNINLFYEYTKKLSEKPKMLVEFDENENLILKEEPKVFFEDPKNTPNFHSYFENANLLFKLVREQAVLKTIKHNTFPIEPCLEFFKETMPRRVDAMRKTVEKVVEMQKIGMLPEVAVFIAGKEHFQLEERDKDIPELSLENFYEELPKHQCVVLSQKKRIGMR